MVTHQIILKKNHYKEKNLRSNLTLSELKYQLIQVSKRPDKFDKKLYEQKKKRKLRENLDIGENVLLLAERIKKKSAVGKF